MYLPMVHSQQHATFILLDFTECPKAELRDEEPGTRLLAVDRRLDNALQRQARLLAVDPRLDNARHRQAR